MLILSARHTVDDRVSGLEAGGDDYLTKPFAFTELLARVQALIRRATAAPGVDPRSPSAISRWICCRAARSRAGREIELRPREFALLEYLMRNAGRVVSKTMILSHVWDYSFDPRTNVVDVLVHRLREKIDKGLRPQADPHRARHRLCPQSGVSGCATRSAFRLALWYAVVFVASSLALIGLTYSLRRRVAAAARPRDHPHGAGAVRDRLRASAASRRSSDEIQRTQATAAPGPLLVRAVGARQDGHLPQQAEDWRRFDLSGSSPSRRTASRRGARSDTGDDGAVLEVASVRLARRHAVPGRHEHRAAHAAARALPARPARQRRLARSSSAWRAARC